jgi:hypothetical protein
VATATAGTYFNEGSSRLKALKQGDQMRLWKKIAQKVSQPIFCQN